MKTENRIRSIRYDLMQGAIITCKMINQKYLLSDHYGTIKRLKKNFKDHSVYELINISDPGKLAEYKLI